MQRNPAADETPKVPPRPNYTGAGDNTAPSSDKEKAATPPAKTTPVTLSGSSTPIILSDELRKAAAEALQQGEALKYLSPAERAERIKKLNKSKAGSLSFRPGITQGIKDVTAAISARSTPKPPARQMTTPETSLAAVDQIIEAFNVVEEVVNPLTPPAVTQTPVAAPAVIASPELAPAPAKPAATTVEVAVSPEIIAAPEATPSAPLAPTQADRASVPVTPASTLQVRIKEPGVIITPPDETSNPVLLRPQGKRGSILPPSKLGQSSQNVAASAPSPEATPAPASVSRSTGTALREPIDAQAKQDSLARRMTGREAVEQFKAQIAAQASAATVQSATPAPAPAAAMSDVPPNEPVLARLRLFKPGTTEYSAVQEIKPSNLGYAISNTKEGNERLGDQGMDRNSYTGTLGVLLAAGLGLTLVVRLFLNQKDNVSEADNNLRNNIFTFAIFVTAFLGFAATAIISSNANAKFRAARVVQARVELLEAKDREISKAAP